MKYILNYHQCSKAALEKYGEVVGGYTKLVSSDLCLLQDKLKVLKSDDSIVISSVSIQKQTPIDSVKFGFDVDGYGDNLSWSNGYYHYESKDLSETLKAHKAAKKSKKNKSVSELFIYETHH
jgi:hypothetical protein